MISPNALAGLLPAVLLAVCLFSPVAVGLSIADDHGSARESERRTSLGRMEFEGRVRVEPDDDFDDSLMGPYEGGPFVGEPDNHVYAFEKNIPSVSRLAQNFPRGESVAIVLRGASFRNRLKKQLGCLADDDKAQQIQKTATQSLVDYVILPLEQAGNTVDVIVTDHACNLTRSLLIPLIGEQRVKAFEQSGEGYDQNRNVLFALDLLAKYSGGVHEVENKYSHVFLMRHDTHWVQPMNEWVEGDFSRVLYPFKCPGWKAVHDLFMLVPAQYFWRFYKGIDLRHCFEAADGHNCMQAMVWHTASEDSVGLAIHYGANGTWLPWYTYGGVRSVC